MSEEKNNLVSGEVQLQNPEKSNELPEHALREMKMQGKHEVIDSIEVSPIAPGIYDYTDSLSLPGYYPPKANETVNLQTLEDLLERDKKREEDGFPRRIRLGKYSKPSENNGRQIVIVPTTTEPKFYHDDSITEDGEGGETGGQGEGEEGEVIGETPAQPQQGEGSGAGQGDDGNHDIAQEAFDLGKVLTEKFKLPNLKDKGKKRSFTKFKYDLTDQNRGFGQFLDKKATLKQIIKTNIMLGNVSGEHDFKPEDLLINPADHVYRIMSKEKDFENQAVVFFLRDYSGSMQGAPTEAVVTQHLFIYSWLMFQYKNNVTSRFILHDNNAKEVPDFHTYHNSAVAGGTSIFPAYELVVKIVEEEHLQRDNNIYVFHGTDGDDWDNGGEKALAAIRKMLTFTNRMGITVAKNSWSGSTASTTVETYIERSGLLKEKSDLFRLDSFIAEGAGENRLVEGIKKLIG